MNLKKDEGYNSVVNWGYGCTFKQVEGDMGLQSCLSSCRSLQHEPVYPQHSVAMLSWERTALRVVTWRKKGQPAWLLKWSSWATSTNKITITPCMSQLGWPALVCAVPQSQQHSPASVQEFVTSRLLGVQKV